VATSRSFAPDGVAVLPSLIRQNRSFRAFFVGQAVSLVGDQVSLIALPLVAVLALDATPAQMGYVVSAALLPNLLFSLHAGAWVDRRGQRRRVMIVADLGRAAALASIPLAYAFDTLTFAQLYAVSFVIGALSVLFFVSYNTLFVALVPRERYVEGNSLLHGSRAFSGMVGPALGGALVQLLKAPVALAADALSFAVSALSLARISPVEPPTEPAERGHVIAGMRYILGSRIIRASLAATATINFFNFVFFALVILYANRFLHVRPGILGLVFGLGATGAVIGAMVTGTLAKRIGIGRAYILGCIVFPVPLVLVPLAAGPRWLVLGCLFLAEFGSGLGVMMLDITSGAIKAALIPDRLRARVSGAYMVVNYGVRPLGAFLGGVMGSAIGVRETLWIATAGGIFGFLWLLPSPVRTLRELPETEEVGLPDHVPEGGPPSPTQTLA
jgi:MFS family permease